MPKHNNLQLFFTGYHFYWLLFWLCLSYGSKNTGICWKRVTTEANIEANYTTLSKNIKKQKNIWLLICWNFYLFELQEQLKQLFNFVFILLTNQFIVLCLTTDNHKPFAEAITRSIYVIKIMSGCEHSIWFWLFYWLCQYW